MTLLGKTIELLSPPPGPKALGWAKSDALPMEGIGHHTNNPTWEDWHRYSEQATPLRYWIHETLPKHYWTIAAPIQHHWRQFRDRYIHRRHLIDTTGMDPLYGSRYGCYSAGNLMELMVWGAIKLYWEKEKPVDPKHWENYQDNEEFKAMGDRYNEVKLLYRYWTHDRFTIKRVIDDLYDKIGTKQNRLVDPEVREHWDRWGDWNHAAQKFEHDLFYRAVRVRDEIS